MPTFSLRHKNDSSNVAEVKEKLVEAMLCLSIWAEQLILANYISKITSLRHYFSS